MRARDSPVHNGPCSITLFIYTQLKLPDRPHGRIQRINISLREREPRESRGERGDVWQGRGLIEEGKENRKDSCFQNFSGPFLSPETQNMKILPKARFSSTENKERISKAKGKKKKKKQSFLRISNITIPWQPPDRIKRGGETEREKQPQSHLGLDEVGTINLQPLSTCTEFSFFRNSDFYELNDVNKTFLSG